MQIRANVKAVVQRGSRDVEVGRVSDKEGIAKRRAAQSGDPHNTVLSETLCVERWCVGGIHMVGIGALFQRQYGRLLNLQLGDSPAMP